ncbi:MAG: alpha/beta fold hydrolase [Deltaproteobacteria bacterium]|nr:alpha/beta fold hydrolase [Deltaproteobacteria bacterium]MBW2415663.1 alpha/beta fold hydrolase [Deltaproteobacteria bacterium]
MPRLRVRDIDLYFERAGSGPRLLYIGGSGGDLRQQPSVFDGLLGKHFDLLSYDQRGLGRTDKPDTAYSMQDYAEDTLGLLDALGWERCLVMGVSFGGMVAQQVAVRAPERIARLVLACTSSGGAGGASYPLHELADLPERERMIRQLELSDVRRDADWRAAHPEDLASALDFMSQRAATGDDRPEDRAGARRQLEARIGHDVADRLSGLSMPVLIAAGLHDGIAPPENQKALESRIPDATLEFFDGGHLFLMQDRSAFPRIVEFLGAA